MSRAKKVFFQILEPFVFGVGAQEIAGKIDNDVRSTPFARVHPCDDENDRLVLSMIFCDLQCVADTTFVGFFRQLEAPAELRIGRFEVDECRRNFRRV
jgi:hypothetical protein